MKIDVKGIHPAAEVFPLMNDEQFKEHKKSIQQNGMYDPIMLSHDGLVVDGRNRMRACIELKIQPRFDTLPIDEDICAYVWAKNGARRDLTPAERAIAVLKQADLVARYEEEARARKVEVGKATGRGHERSSSIDYNLSTDSGRVDEKLAEMGNVSPSMVSKVRRLGRYAPDLHEKVENGELTVDGAIRELRRRKREESGEKAKPEDKMEANYKEVRRKVHRVSRQVEQTKGAIEALLADVRNFKDACKKEERMDLHVKVSQDVLRITKVGDWIRSRTVGVRQPKDTD